MKCSNPCPWDCSRLCTRPAGHTAPDPHHPRAALHEHGNTRWSDATHFPGDDCGPHAHSDNQETEHHNPGGPLMTASPLDLTPVPPAEPPTLTKAESWLRDCADGLWAAPKYADLYAPVLMAEYHRRGDELAAAEARLTELEDETRQLRAMHRQETTVLGKACLLTTHHDTANRFARARLTRTYARLVEQLATAIRGELA